MIHELETEQKDFAEFVAGNKTFEICDERGFCPGDFLALNEINKDKDPTGRCSLFKITYVQSSFEMLNGSHVALAIKPCVISDRTASTIFEHEDIYKAPVYVGDIEDENKK